LAVLANPFRFSGPRRARCGRGSAHGRRRRLVASLGVSSVGPILGASAKLRLSLHCRGRRARTLLRRLRPPWAPAASPPGPGTVIGTAAQQGLQGRRSRAGPARCAPSSLCVGGNRREIRRQGGSREWPHLEFHSCLGVPSCHPRHALGAAATWRMTVSSRKDRARLPSRTSSLNTRS
jgi:hypothetical protein